MLFLRRPRAALVAVMLASSLGATAAVAQTVSVEAAAEPPLRLTWESEDPACSGDDVSTRALRMISPGVVPRPLRARVEVRRDGDQWLVRLQTESGDQSGRRILRAESCSGLEQAIALLLAMAMESKGDVLPPEPPAPPATPEPAPPAPPAVGVAPASPVEIDIGDEPDDALDESSGIGIGWFLRLDAKAAHGLTPGLGLGVGISGGIRLGDFDIGASATHWPSTRARASDRPGYVDLSRQDISLRACWNAWRTGGLTLGPCIAPQLTFFRYETKEVRFPNTGTKGPDANVTAGLDARYALFGDNLSLSVTPGVTVERVQPFVIGLSDGPAGSAREETTEVFETARFAPRLELGVDARF